jgi:DNA replication initiation complex subunit (GINS family)
MDLEKDYKGLYQHWLREFNQKELTQLTETTIKNYKKMLEDLKHENVQKADIIKKKLLEQYIENIDYLFNDLLLMREVKIINKALILEDLNFKNVISPEKMLYQNIVSGLKGYNKMKALSIIEEFEETKGEEEIDSVINQEDIFKGLDKPKSTIEQEISTGDNSESESMGERTIQEFEKTKPKNLQVKNNIKTPQEINYVLIRFIKKTPALVGVDFINYGPFKEQDIANLPEKNANILLIEKFAEKIEVN